MELKEVVKYVSELQLDDYIPCCIRVLCNNIS
jgi:hypothetical protein